MTFDEYLAINALNWSTLKRLTVSPRALEWEAQNPKAPTDAMKLGTAIHCAVLEPDEFTRRYIVKPDFGDMRRKENKSARAEWEEKCSGLFANGAEMISVSDYDTARRVAEAIEAHGPANEILGEGVKERSIVWTHPETGIKCKGRLDVCGSRVVDLKSHSKATLREIIEDAARRDYHGQLAWYHDGAVQSEVLAAGAPLPCAVFVQTVAPYDVAVLDMEQAPETFDAGRELYESLIRKYDGCKTANWWPGMAPEPVAWTLPRWKVRESNER